MYKQKLKHVLAEHHDTVSGLKMDVGAASLLTQNQNSESELSLRRATQAQQADLREKKVQDLNCTKELELVS